MGVHLGDKAVGVGFVTEKEVPKIKFGAGIDNIIGNLDANGDYVRPTEEFDLVFDGLKRLNTHYTLYLRFARQTGLRNVYMPDLTRVQGTYALREIFQEASIKRFYAPKLVTVPGNTCLYKMFYSAAGLVHVDLAALETVYYGGSNQGMGYAFGLTGLKTMYFYSLTNVGKYAFDNLFYNNKNIEEVHFRMDAQAVIESLNQYGSKWGGTNATIYFDLVGKITVDGIEYARKEVDTIRVDWERVWVAWEDANGNIIYTSASGEPAVGTAVYSDAGITQVGTVSEVA